MLAPPRNPRVLDRPAPSGERTAPRPEGRGARLQKVLAQAGLGSRRRIETWIQAGRINVNGVAAVLGQRVGAGDRVTVDGRAIRIAAGTQATARVLLYHKPAGEIVSRDDPERRPTVYARLPALRRERWIAVGRLDFNSSGLLLFTNSGELAYRLMHPSFGVKRVYAVRLLGQLSEQQKRQLLSGVELADGCASLDTVEEAGGGGANRWYRVSLREGRNREVRRLFDALGLRVSRLIRIGYGPVSLPRWLRSGRYVELPPEAVRNLASSDRSQDLERDTMKHIARRPGNAGRSGAKRRACESGRSRA